MPKSQPRLHKASQSIIPDGFNINKYDSCKDWGAKEWLDAISYRASLKMNWINFSQKDLGSEGFDKSYDLYKSRAQQLIEMPLLYRSSFNRTSRNRYITDQCVADIFKDCDDERLQGSSWRTDFNKWASSPPVFRYLLDRNSILIEKIEVTPTWHMKKELWDQTGTATINVDLTGSKVDIVKEFKTWLSQTKDKMKLPKRKINIKIKEDTFTIWHNDRVLPIFDLLFYKDIFNIELTKKAITETIFPAKDPSKIVSKHKSKPISEPISDEAVRKTKIPFSVKTVSQDAVDALRKFLYYENKTT